MLKEATSVEAGKTKAIKQWKRHIARTKERHWDHSNFSSAYSACYQSIKAKMQ